MPTTFITQVTRRKIFDTITLSEVLWEGRLGEPDFLARIYNLDTMPSTDSRFTNRTRLIRTTNTQPVTTAAIEVDVDCEFDRDGKVYLWGALLSTPTTDPTYYAFSSPTPDFDEHALASEFHAWIGEQLTDRDGAAAFWFHYGSTEPRQLHRILGPAVRDVLARGIDVLTDMIRPDFYGPVGYSLKQLAPAAGAHWRTIDATGVDTFDWIDAARAKSLSLISDLNSVVRPSPAAMTARVSTRRLCINYGSSRVDSRRSHNI